MSHVTRFLVSLAVVATLVTGSSPAALVQEARPSSEPPYGIVELETIEGAGSWAYSINDRGWIAGHVYDAEGRQRAMLWRDGDVTDLGSLGGDQTGALDVNDRGQVVGQSATAPGATLDDPGSHAFLWDAGRMRDLGTLGGDMSSAQGVNERGQVVGASTTAPGQLLDLFTDGPRAFLWENGHMTDLGILGGDRSWAFAINDAGQVVGTAQTATGEDHAFLWQDGHMTDLGTLGGDQAIALAINRHSQVVGGSTTATGQTFSELGTLPFLWDAGDMTALGDASRSEGIAYAINDRGGVVGNDPDIGAVLWRGEETVPLAQLRPEGDGLKRLSIARSINERGQIAGWGHRDGATRAFVASPATLEVAPASSPSASTPTAYIAGLEAAEVVERAQRAIQKAGAYRYQVFQRNGVDGEPTFIGEVEIGRGTRTQAADGSNLEYFDGQTLYTLRPDGEWLVRVPTTARSEVLLGFLDSSPDQWELMGVESVDGRPSYVIERITQETSAFKATQTLWIDATTFIPYKETWQNSVGNSEHLGPVTVYSDFGAPVDVIPPAAALAPTPTPEPLPETSGGSVTIALRDIFFEPKEVTIPVNEDVLIVLPNEGAARHNFTIDEFGISSGDIEWGTTGHVVVNLPPGVYEFRCTVPGHTEAGQVGTLTVRN